MSFYETQLGAATAASGTKGRCNRPPLVFIMPFMVCACSVLTYLQIHSLRNKAHIGMRTSEMREGG